MPSGFFDLTWPHPNPTSPIINLIRPIINLILHGANFKSRFFTLFSRLYGSRWIVQYNKRQKRAKKCVICEKNEFQNFMLYAKSRSTYIVKRKAYNTKCSQAVTHPSTNSAQRCLTSVIGRELVHSTWYGRRRCWSKKEGYLNALRCLPRTFWDLEIFPVFSDTNCFVITNRDRFQVLP